MDVGACDPHGSCRHCFFERERERQREQRVRCGWLKRVYRVSPLVLRDTVVDLETESTDGPPSEGVSEWLALLLLQLELHIHANACESTLWVRPHTQTRTRRHTRDRWTVRMDAASELLTWLQAEGASVNPSVAPNGAPRRAASASLRRDRFHPERTSFPYRAAMFSGPATACDGIGEALRSLKLTDQQPSRLLYARQRGSSSPYNSYVCTLPTEHDLASRCHTSGPRRSSLNCSVERRSCCRHSGNRTRCSHSTRISSSVCCSPNGRTIQPARGILVERLSWAAAVWSSRAIRLELPGGARECLVLLDMMNHTPGLSTRARAPPRPRRIRRPARASRRRGRGAFLNYGAKGNGELLRCHGFVLDHNPCDLFESTIAARRARAACAPQDAPPLSAAARRRRCYPRHGSSAHPTAPSLPRPSLPSTRGAARMARGAVKMRPPRHCNGRQHAAARR